jgi:hypothetical protein
MEANPLAAVASEDAFQTGIRQTPWFKEFKEKHGEEPNLDDPNYDYRAAWRAGSRPEVRDPGDGMLHWSSQFKGENHPNRYVDGVDTITGKPQAPLASVWSKLSQTWPAKLAHGMLQAMQLPGDVYQGKVSMLDEYGRTNPEVIGRSADLAGMVMGGSFAAAPAGALGAGPVINRDKFKKIEE